MANQEKISYLTGGKDSNVPIYPSSNSAIPLDHMNYPTRNRPNSASNAIINALSSNNTTNTSNNTTNTSNNTINTTAHIPTIPTVSSGIPEATSLTPSTTGYIPTISAVVSSGVPDNNISSILMNNSSNINSTKNNYIPTYNKDISTNNPNIPLKVPVQSSSVIPSHSDLSTSINYAFNNSNSSNINPATSSANNVLRQHSCPTETEYSVVNNSNSNNNNNNNNNNIPCGAPSLSNMPINGKLFQTIPVTSSSSSSIFNMPTTSANIKQNIQQFVPSSATPQSHLTTVSSVPNLLPSTSLSSPQKSYPYNIGLPRNCTSSSPIHNNNHLRNTHIKDFSNNDIGLDNNICDIRSRSPTMNRSDPHTARYGRSLPCSPAVSPKIQMRKKESKPTSKEPVSRKKSSDSSVPLRKKIGDGSVLQKRKRRSIDSSTKKQNNDEPEWQRRLSLLFVPPSAEDLHEEEHQIQGETARLLDGALHEKDSNRGSGPSGTSTGGTTSTGCAGSGSGAKPKNISTTSSSSSPKVLSRLHSISNSGNLLISGSEGRLSYPIPDDADDEQLINEQLIIQLIDTDIKEDIRVLGRDYISEDRLACLDILDERGNESEFGSSTGGYSSITDYEDNNNNNKDNKDDHHDDDDDDDDEDDDSCKDKEDGYSSWDDTICSNRSAYFKLYYQRGLAASSSNGRSGGGDKTSRGSRALSSNSLASLIRERMAGKDQTPPAQKTKADLGLLILVVVLFLIIVIGISVIYIFYHRHLLEVLIFKQLKFKEDVRLLEVYSPIKDDGSQTLIATAALGMTLSRFKSIPEDCTHYLHYLNDKESKQKSTNLNSHQQDSSSSRSSSSSSSSSSNTDTQGTNINSMDSNDEVNISLMATSKGSHSGMVVQHDDDDEEIVCLDWVHEGRLLFQKLLSKEDINCFQITWTAPRVSMVLQDCVNINGGQNGVWWGGGEVIGATYPINNGGKISTAPLLTGELNINTWGHILRHVFLSSNGVLIALSEDVPANISVNYQTDGHLCFSTTATQDLTPSVLNYTICTAPNITTLHRYLHETAIQRNVDIIKETSRETNLQKNTNIDIDEIKDRVIDRIENPVWIPWLAPDKTKLTQDIVIDYVNQITSKHSDQWGHILLPITWQKNLGDLSFDIERFPNPREMADYITRQGFRLALSVSPMVASDTDIFKNGTADGLWVKQYRSTLPVLAQTPDVIAAAITDFTNQRSADWYTNRLIQLQKSYTIDRFHLIPNTAYILPKFHEFHVNIDNPDRVLELFQVAVARLSPPISTTTSITVPPAPTFVTISSSDGSWEDLKTLIPRVLTLSIIGMPFIDTGVVGGGTCRSGHVPDRELYVRWLQAATFLPAIQSCILPHVYDKNVEAIYSEYNKKRKNLVLPRFKESIQDSLDKGVPLVSPLALIFKDDHNSIDIGDQWMVGGDLLVAPVLKRGERTRDVYLPPGFWKDLMDGQLKKGGAWIYNYGVPLTKVALFKLITPVEIAKETSVN